MDAIAAKYLKVQRWRRISSANWQKKNRDKHNEMIRKYYNKRKTDTEYMNHRNARARLNYRLRKEKKKQEAQK